MSYDLENQSIKIEVRLLAVQYPIVFVVGANRMIQALAEGHLYISFSFIWYLNALQLFSLWFLELLLIARLASDCWARIGMFHE